VDQSSPILFVFNVGGIAVDNYVDWLMRHRY